MAGRRDHANATYVRSYVEWPTHSIVMQSLRGDGRNEAPARDERRRGSFIPPPTPRAAFPPPRTVLDGRQELLQAPALAVRASSCRLDIDIEAIGRRRDGGNGKGAGLRGAVAIEDVVVLCDGAMLDRKSVGVGAVSERRPWACSSRRRPVSARVHSIAPRIDLGHRQTSLDASASDTRTSTKARSVSVGVKKKEGTAQNEEGKACKGEANGLLHLLLLHVVVRNAPSSYVALVELAS